MTSVFVFCPDGTIFIAFFNIPVFVHDSQVAHWGRMYDKLGALYDETDGKCTDYSAFGMVNRSFLIKSLQDSLISTTMQSSFPRLKDTFVYEDTGEHCILMKMVCLLYNLRARIVGINQIKMCS